LGIFLGGGGGIKQRSKRRRIWLFGRLKRTEDLLPPSPSPPPPQQLPPVQTTKLEVEEEQSKWEAEVVLVDHRREKDIESLAAIKIQTAYRGYLVSYLLVDCPTETTPLKP